LHTPSNRIRGARTMGVGSLAELVRMTEKLGTSPEGLVHSHQVIGRLYQGIIDSLTSRGIGFRREENPIPAMTELNQSKNDALIAIVDDDAPVCEALRVC
jgi:hypothetical protein